MICDFKRLLYPKVTPDCYDGSYAVALYTPSEKLLDTQGYPVREVKVVGCCLPVAAGLRFNLFGRWGKTAKFGPQFELDRYEDVITPGKDGVIAYLCSGLIKGIGPKTAERIYSQFGDRSLEVLDSSPDELLKIPGISKNKLTKILDTYLASRGARDIVAFLAPHGVTPNRAVKIYKEYGQQAIEIVREHPYRLCEMAGIGFHTADKIAKNVGMNPLAPERIRAGLLQVLKDAEAQGGNLCLENGKLLSLCTELLATESLTERMAAEECSRMLKDGTLAEWGGFIYRFVTAYAEQSVARRVCELLRFGTVSCHTNLDVEIAARQKQLQISLAHEQRHAIKTSLTSNLSIITGGPGTGKTLIQRFLLDIYRKEHPNGRIVCCAPTGRAARRMEQCTGYPASTIHKALGLLAGDDGGYSEPQKLEADFVLVDEISMLDIYLARHLLNAVPDGCQMVLVGDADQLPSVGPGAVLSELIASGEIPVVKLDRVYRQDSGSRVAVNASLIRHGDKQLEEGVDFKICQSTDFDQSADIIERLYLEEVARCGVDNVALLTPFRVKTATGRQALNERIRAKINPPAPHKSEACHGNRLYRLGDKVMQEKNKDNINNGDIGYVTGITKADGDTTVTIDFGDGRVAEYDSSELDLLELAYASTVHKSQGAEYQSVIVNLQTAHYKLLKRPLVYTAITRAKERVVVVGDRKALAIAISTVDAEKRGTQLAARIQQILSGGKTHDHA
ncbi:MAG: ATP-dependent RecD-like DNA helicase [Firmicutes bacterium]|nr:ATP-dependent RecD-like DNA helicase [Bacillota bacterium]